MVLYSHHLAGAPALAMFSLLCCCASSGMRMPHHQEADEQGVTAGLLGAGVRGLGATTAFSLYAPEASAVTVAPVDSRVVGWHSTALHKAPPTPVASTSSSCAAALAVSCPGALALGECSICCGQHQHVLRAAGCSATDCAGYCATSGVWVGEVAGMLPGDGYVMGVHGQRTGGQADRIDPSCTDISIDSSHSIVPASYTWRNPRKSVPQAEAVIYEMLVGAFTPAGTLQAAAEKLPYLAELGITVVELMPVMHFCGDSDSWGYCPRAPFAVRPELGGSLGLKRFVDAAADLNLSVAMDLVWNHAADDSLLINFDQPHLGKNCDSESGECGSYFSSGAAEATPWGPRPNFADQEIRKWIVAQVRMLIDDFHVSAFRWDSTSCIRQAGVKLGDSACDTDNAEGWLLMQEANTMAHGGARSSGTWMVAEDTWGAPFPAIWASVNDTSAAGPNGTHGGAGFDGQWA